MPHVYNPPEDTVEHILFHCPFSKSCWQILNMDWGPIGDRLHIIERGKSTWQGPLYMESSCSLLGTYGRRGIDSSLME
jgi:hypothetical protein